MKTLFAQRSDKTTGAGADEVWSREQTQLDADMDTLSALVAELDAATTEMQSSADTRRTKPGTTPEQGLQRYNGSLRVIEGDIAHAKEIAARITATLNRVRTLGRGIIEPKQQQTLTKIEDAAARLQLR